MESADRPTSLTEKPIKDYNTIFERFVGASEEAPQDLLGIVAYGIYKHAKREWVADIRTRFARPPTEDELRA